MAVVRTTTTRYVAEAQVGKHLTLADIRELADTTAHLPGDTYTHLLASSAGDEIYVYVAEEPE